MVPSGSGQPSTLMDNSTFSHEQQHHQQQQLLATSFHNQGYLTLSPLLSPVFTFRLLHECSFTFQAVLHYLRQNNEIDFDTPSRPKKSESEYSNANEDFEYPMGAGVKNGYKELVMRSPGRFELALLVDPVNLGEEGGDKRKQKVLSKELLFGGRSSSKDVPTGGCATLELLLEWINEGIANEYREFPQQLDPMQPQPQPQQEEQFSQDHLQIQKLLHLINTIFNEPQTNPNTTKGFRLIHFSLLLSTPGSQTQSWHADGGHIHLQSHAPPHCLNVFVPLVDLCPSLGPTELRPKSHYYTRDLTKMVLGAMARKEWETAVMPVLRRGEALLFDYRILHRGRANQSHVVVDDDDDDDGEKDCERDECANGEKKGVNHGQSRDERHGGRDRPILVMTFAKSWFVDVCNFPKRSIFSLPSECCPAPNE
jgi:hypothetical protein